jgi:hypothetical protein
MWENDTLRCSALDMMTLFICVISEDWKKQTVIAGKPHTAMTVGGLPIIPDLPRFGHYFCIYS